eukprot:11593142-Alexandrium_andersonii.AAC.1
MVESDACAGEDGFDPDGEGGAFRSAMDSHPELGLPSRLAACAGTLRGRLSLLRQPTSWLCASLPSGAVRLVERGRLRASGGAPHPSGQSGAAPSE